MIYLRPIRRLLKEHMRTNCELRIANCNSRGRSGYIFLVSVLIIGAVLSATSFTLMLLGLGAELSGKAIQDSVQAYENASSCAERALLALRSDLAYDGHQTIAMPSGSCTIGWMGGSGNFDRVICVEGTEGTSVRRMEITIDHVLPATTIRSWVEVDGFTHCP